MINWHLVFRPGGVAVRVRSSGLVTVRVGSETKSATASSSIDDGNVSIEFDNLPINADIPVVVSAGGETETSHFRLPDPARWSFMWLTCWDRRGQFTWSDRALARDVVPSWSWFGGDIGYSEFRYTAFGESYIPANLVPVANQLPHARQCFRQVLADPRIRNLYQHVPMIASRDDHEAPGNNRDKTGESLNQANLETSEGGDQVITNDPAEIAQVFEWWDQAFSEYFADEHYCNGTGYYGSWRQGNALFLLTDTITERDPVAQAQAETKYQMSPAQEAWFYQQLDANQDAGFVFWLSAKEIYQDNFNNDGWHQYRHQRRRLIAALSAHPACTVALTGDVHYPCVTESQDNGVVEFKTAPASLNWLYTGHGYDSEPADPQPMDEYKVRWRPEGFRGSVSTRNCNVGYVDIDGDIATVTLQFEDGREFKWLLKAGQKGIYRPRIKLG